MHVELCKVHKISTYQEIANEIAHPKEKIELADPSMAKQLRNTQQGSIFDDEDFFKL